MYGASMTRGRAFILLDFADFWPLLRLTECREEPLNSNPVSLSENAVLVQDFFFQDSTVIDNGLCRANIVLAAAH